MIPTLTAAVLLLTAAVVYFGYRLQKLSSQVTAADTKKLAAAAPCPHHNMPLSGMPSEDAARARHLVELLFPVHAWHGVSPGDKAPDKVNAVIEIVPGDRVKYELDKPTGMLAIDRPQFLVNGVPYMYGFIPRTLCAEQVGKHCEEHTKLAGIQGDGDPIDILVLTEKEISSGNILVHARPIGGLRMIDSNSADDKIVAVLEGDLIFGHLTDISQLDPVLINRLKNYFLTYKQLPDETERKVAITDVYGAEEAKDIIGLSLQDYREHYGAPENRFEQLCKLLWTYWSQSTPGQAS